MERQAEHAEKQPSWAAKKGTWLTFRPDIKVFDCTVRDGGLMNNSRFEDAFVKAVYQTCLAAGVDYMELGYKASRRLYSKDEFGCWKFCAEDDVRRIVGDNPTELKLSVMADVDRTDYHDDIPPKDQSVIDTYRIATYIHIFLAAFGSIFGAALHTQNHLLSCDARLIGTGSLENAKTNNRLAIWYGCSPLRLIGSISGGAAMIGLSWLANCLRAAASGSLSSLMIRISDSSWYPHWEVTLLLSMIPLFFRCGPQTAQMNGAHIVSLPLPSSPPCKTA